MVRASDHNPLRPRLFETTGAIPSANLTKTIHRPVTGTSFSATPIHDEQLGYELDAPAGWIWIDPRQKGLLGVIAPPSNDEGPLITVHVDKIPWELDRLGWLLYRCEFGGLEVTRARPHATRANTFELLGTRGETQWMTLATIQGGRVFMCTAESPRTRWLEDIERLRPTLESFRALAKAPCGPLVEALRIHKTPTLAYSAPASFFSAQPASSSNGPQYLQAKGLLGFLRIDSDHSKDSLSERLESDLIDAGWERLGPTTSTRSGLRGFINNTERTATYRGDEYTIRTSLRYLPETFVEYVAATPRSPSNLIDAMRTNRALEIAVDTTRAHSSVADDPTIVVATSLGKRST